MTETVHVVDERPRLGRGTAGLPTQAGGAPTTVGAVAARTGGIGNGHLIETDSR